jgi:hypothetical protein
MAVETGIPGNFACSDHSCEGLAGRTFHELESMQQEVLHAHDGFMNFLGRENNRETLTGRRASFQQVMKIAADWRHAYPVCGIEP